MNDTVIAATIVSAVVTFVVTAGMYIWVASALHAVFAKTGQDTWRAWVPFLNTFTVLQLGGFSGWWVLLALFPPAAVVLYVILVIAAHRINLGFDFGAPMTVLAALLFPVWASVLGWGSADNWQPATPVAGPRRTGGPARGSSRRPGPGELGVPRAVSDRLFAGFAPAPIDSDPDSAAPAGDDVPARPAQAPAEPVSQVPLSHVPHSPAEDRSVEPVVAVPDRPAPEPVTPPVPEQAAAQAASAAEHTPGDEASPPAQAGRARTDVDVDGVAGDEDPQAVTPDSFASLVRSGAGEPSPRRRARAERAEPASVDGGEQPVDDMEDLRRHHPTPFTGTTSIPASGIAEPVAAADAAPPRPARPDAAAEVDPAAEADAASGAEPVAAPAARDPWAPPPPTRRTPLRTTRSPEAFPDTSDEVSAVAGAPSAGLPMSALSSVSARAGQDASAPPPAAKSAPEPADEGFDETMIASRRRISWSLTPPHGEDIPLTGEVAIIGRRPAADPNHPTAQLIAIDDRTRTMSKTHARLELRADRWRIVDLRSTNGVVLQEPDGTEVELAAGQSLPVTETFLLGDAPLRLSRDLG